MNSGMLWFDNDPKTGLAQKIEKAVDYYRQKYGRTPNLCLVHPETPLSAAPTSPQMEELNLGGQVITVRPYRPVLPGHLSIGVEDAAQGVERASAELVRQAEHNA